MTDAAALVKALRNGGAWEAVAETLRECGCDHPRNYWRKVSLGLFVPGWRELDALRVANGLPAGGPPPADLVRDCGVSQAVQLHANPDTALLVDLEGKSPVSVAIRTAGESSTTTAPKARVTKVTLQQGARQRRQSSVPTVPAILAEPTHPEGRGRSGNREAIETAARRASQQVAVRGNMSERERRELTALLGGEE